MNSPFTGKKQTTNRIVVTMEMDKSMDPEIIEWEGGQQIGSDKLTLDPASN